MHARHEVPDDLDELLSLAAEDARELLAKLAEPRYAKHDQYDRDGHPVRRWRWWVQKETYEGVEVLREGRAMTKRAAVRRADRADRRLLKQRTEAACKEES